jgi:hypothetical protein
VKSLWRAVVARRDPDETLMIVKTLTSHDGTRVAEIARREDGAFRYMEHCKLTERGMTYWKDGLVSEVFASQEAAEADARARLCWLRPEGCP